MPDTNDGSVHPFAGEVRTTKNFGKHAFTWPFDGESSGVSRPVGRSSGLAGDIGDRS